MGSPPPPGTLDNEKNLKGLLLTFIMSETKRGPRQAFSWPKCIRKTQVSSQHTGKSARNSTAGRFSAPPVGGARRGNLLLLGLLPRQLQQVCQTGGKFKMSADHPQHMAPRHSQSSSALLLPNIPLGKRKDKAGGAPVEFCRALEQQGTRGKEPGHTQGAWQTQPGTAHDKLGSLLGHKQACKDSDWLCETPLDESNMLQSTRDINGSW